MLKYYTCSSFLLLATAFSFSQTIKFKGRVINEANNTVANVSVTGSQNGIIKLYTVSDSNGIFNLVLLQNQKYLLQLTCVGYKKLATEILANTALDEVIPYKLEKQVNSIDTVKVTAKRGYYERGDTIFYTTDVYKRNNENNLKDLLNNLPGVEVTSAGKIVVDGQVVSKVLIEGKDLTGDDYEKLINNLSPHNLDQVQVLKKYRDPFTLSNSVTRDSEVAINLTFKKKRLIPSAKFSLSLGLPIDYFEQKTDFLITTKHITGLCFANWNTIGNTFQFIVPPKELLGNYQPASFSKLGRGLNYFNRVNELYLPITKNLYSFNNTKYFDNSSQINFSKNTTDKISITYSPEKVEQTENTFIQTYNGSQVLSETKSLRNPVIKNKKLIVKNEFIWMLKASRQFKMETSFEKENIVADNNGLLNTKATLIGTDNKKTIFRNLINYTTYLKRSRLLNAALFYDHEKNKELLNTEGIAYSGALYNTSFGAVKNLNQRKINDEYNAGAYLKIIKYKNNYSITIQPMYRFLKGNFFSDLNSNSVTGFTFNNIDSFNNKFGYHQNSFSVPVRYKYSDEKDIISFSLNAEPFVLLRQKFHSIEQRFRSGFNANTDFTYNFKNKKSISIRGSRNYQISAVEQMLQNNIIKGNRNIQSKSSFITNSASYNFSVSLNNKTFNKKSKNSYTIGYRINDPNFISNSTNNNLYSLYTYISFMLFNRGINGMVRNEITIKQLKLRLEQSAIFSTGTNYVSQNEKLISNLSKNFTLENRVKSRFANSFNFEWSNSLSYINSKAQNSSISYKNYLNTSTLLVNINYMKKIHLDFSFKDFYFYTPSNKQKNHLLFTGISYKQLFNKNKIRFTTEFNNITNKRKFNNHLISATQYNETSTILIPVYALAKIEFLL